MKQITGHVNTEKTEKNISTKLEMFFDIKPSVYAEVVSLPKEKSDDRVIRVLIKIISEDKTKIKEFANLLTTMGEEIKKSIKE